MTRLNMLKFRGRRIKNIRDKYNLDDKKQQQNSDQPSEEESNQPEPTSKVNSDDGNSNKSTVPLVASEEKETLQEKIELTAIGMMYTMKDEIRHEIMEEIEADFGGKKQFKDAKKFMQNYNKKMFEEVDINGKHKDDGHQDEGTANPGPREPDNLHEQVGGRKKKGKKVESS